MTDSSSNQSLINQYPFVTTILNTPMEPKLTPSGEYKDTLIIKVEEADGDLMYRRADNIGIYGDKGFMFSLAENRSGQVKRKGEHLFAIDPRDRVIRHLEWPIYLSPGSSPTFVWSILWKTKKGDWYSDNIADSVRFLVWVTIESWHDRVQDTDNPFGQLLERNVTLTIYPEPKSGFDELSENSSVEENLYLDREILEHARQRNDDQIYVLRGRIDELCRILQDSLAGTLIPGGIYTYSTPLGEVKLEADPVSLSLSDDQNWIMFGIRENNTLYVFSFKGILPRLRNLIMTVVCQRDTD